MDIVRGNIFRRVARPHLDQLAVQVSDLFDIVLLQFHEEAVFAKDIVIPVHAPHGFFGFVIQQGSAEFRRTYIQRCK